jgi:hypothetical protein
MASEAITAENLDLARRLLEECDPTLRDDAWKRLHLACFALRRIWQAFEGPALSLAVRDDGREVAGASRNKGFIWELNAPDHAPLPVQLTTFPLDIGYTADGQLVYVSTVSADWSKVTF